MIEMLPVPMVSCRLSHVPNNEGSVLVEPLVS